MSRRSPVYLPPSSSSSPSPNRGGPERGQGLATRAASEAAHVLLNVLDYRRRNADMMQLLSGTLLLLLGISLACSAAITDS
ncbi:MAG: hypothetical protein H0W23_06220 [Chloroflexia bacterium]|nr:hypothetical protein [Chloroflexia bacterium]